MEKEKITLRRVLAVLIGLAGLTWFMQGIGAFTVVDSFMNNDWRWAVIGIVTAAAALALWTWEPKGK